MSQNRQALEASKEQVKQHLPSYLAKMGINMSGTLFRCINPDHPDNNPSCGLVPGSGDRIFHCFSCGAVGDIFVASHFLEGKPLAGPGFVTDNLIPLAQVFGVDIPELAPQSEEDVFLADTKSAYAHAALVVRSTGSKKWSERVKEKVKSMSWDERLMAKLGVGAVQSYDAFITQMTKMYGHKREFLDKVGLAKKSMFNENMLIFTVKTEDGMPVGFACRNLRYEEDKAKYAKRVDELREHYGEDSEEFKTEVAKVFRPTKYVNTSADSPIYNKSRLLYLFSEARKNPRPLWVFEGYPDGVTAHMGGMSNATAIGAVAFTEEHLEMLLGLGIKHLIFVLDADDAGQDAMERIVKMLTKMGGHPGLTVELVSMPEGTDDPDAFIRKHGDFKKGVQAIRQLPRMDMFAWSLRERLRAGQEPLDVAQDVIPLIVNEVNNLKRMGMVHKLAQQTNLDESMLTREVQRQLDTDLAGLQEENLQLALRMAKDLQKNPHSMQVIVEDYRHKVEVLNKRRTGYDHANVISSVDHVFENLEKNTKHTELETGYSLLDQVMGGIPRAEAFISVPGGPNQGKSTLFHNLCWRLPERNEDCTVFFQSVDDALSACLPRIMGSKIGVPSNWFKRPNFFRDQVEDFDKIYHEAREWLRELMEHERLIVVDIATLPASLPAYETWVRTIRNRYPSREIVCMGDNFHLYDLPGEDPGEGKIREMSKFIKRLANQYQTTQMFTMELPKTAFKSGMRPRMSNIKGSSGMAYDANANFGVYNDMKSRAEKANLYWDGPPERILGPNGEESFGPKKMPVLELVIDKSKLSSFDGSIFFRFWPEQGRLEECCESDQVKYRSLVSDFHHTTAEQSEAQFRSI
jgi:DNA primase/GTPase SAR1 family protein